jgi:hypothetical protein
MSRCYHDNDTDKKRHARALWLVKLQSSRPFIHSSICWSHRRYATRVKYVSGQNDTSEADEDQKQLWERGALQAIMG